MTRQDLEKLYGTNYSVPIEELMKVYGISDTPSSPSPSGIGGAGGGQMATVPPSHPGNLDDNQYHPGVNPGSYLLALQSKGLSGSITPMSSQGPFEFDQNIYNVAGSPEGFGMTYGGAGMDPNRWAEITRASLSSPLSGIGIPDLVKKSNTAPTTRPTTTSGTLGTPTTSQPRTTQPGALSSPIRYPTSRPVTSPTQGTPPPTGTGAYARIANRVRNRSLGPGGSY